MLPIQTLLCIKVILSCILTAESFCFDTGPWRDCLQALEDGHDTSSIYLVKPENTNRLMQVWCDQRHDPGGWTVIQRRLDGSVNFFRNWETYKVRTSEQFNVFYPLKIIGKVNLKGDFRVLTIDFLKRNLFST